MAYSHEYPTSTSACPLADNIERDWSNEYPLGSNVIAQVYCGAYFFNFENEDFDRQPTSDVILFKNSSIDFEVHAHYKPIEVTMEGGSRVINAVAMKIKSQKIQYNADDDSFLVDGRLTACVNNWIFLPECETTIVKIDARKFHIYTGLGPRLTVYNCGCYNLNITLTVPRRHAESADPSLFGTLAGRHGQVIPATGIFLPGT